MSRDKEHVPEPVPWKRTRSQQRRARINAYASTIRRAVRRFQVSCPVMCRHWVSGAILSIVLIWLLFAVWGNPSYLDSLFAGLAFAGVLIALSLQRADLRLQRQEMSDMRHEMARQTKLQAEQILSASMFSHVERMYKLRDEGKSAIAAKGVSDPEEMFSKLVKHVEAYLLHGNKAKEATIISEHLFSLNHGLSELTPFAYMFLLWNSKVESAELTRKERLKYKFELENGFNFSDKILANLCLIRRKRIPWNAHELRSSEIERSLRCTSLRVILLETTLLTCSPQNKMWVAYAAYKLLSDSMELRDRLAAQQEKGRAQLMAKYLSAAIQDYRALPQEEKWFPSFLKEHQGTGQRDM